MVYLAAPYSHKDPAVVEARYHQINRNVVKLMNDGLLVYSPITHNHVLAATGDMPKGWEYWYKHDLGMLQRCDALYVLKMEGWDMSIGVDAEMSFARQNNIPIYQVEPIP